MKKKRRSPDKDLPFLTVEATLDSGTAALGVRPDEPYFCGPHHKDKKHNGTDRQTAVAVFTDERTEDGAAELCRCRITVYRDAGEWLPVPQSSFFRFRDAMTERCLSLVSDTVGFDLFSHLTGIKAVAPPESPPQTLARYGEPMQKLADKLFPEKQTMRITEIRETGIVPVLRLEKTDGFTAAPFRAGQYVMISKDDSDSTDASPFLLCSSPAGAQEGYYLVTPAPDDTGTVLKEAVGLLNLGETVYVSAPQGDFYHVSLLDRDTVIGLTDPTGIGAFLSIACALRDGFDRYRLTVICLEPSGNGHPFAEEFDALRDVVSLIRLPDSDAQTPLTPAFFRDHMPHASYSVFVCGDARLTGQAKSAMERLHLPERCVRYANLSASELTTTE